MGLGQDIWWFGREALTMYILSYGGDHRYSAGRRKASIQNFIYLMFKDTYGEKETSNKISAFTKSINMDTWVAGNQINSL